MEFGDVGKGDFAPGEPFPTNKKGEASDLAFKRALSGSVVGGVTSGGNDVHAAAALVEGDLAVHQGEQGPVATGANILAGDEPRTTLTDEDAACGDHLAAVALHSESFADAVTAVTNAALTFFMCHIYYPLISVILTRVSS